MRLITSPNVIFIQIFVVVIKDTYTEEKIVKFRVVLKFIKLYNSKYFYLV